MQIDRKTDASGDTVPSMEDSSILAERGDAWRSTIATTRLIPAIDDLCQELLRRWREGDRVPVEHYLELHPTLRTREIEAFELIYTEFLVREELDRSHPLDEFLARFPGHTEQLRRQLEMHRAFDSMDATGWRNDDTIFPKPPESQVRWPAPAGYQIDRVLGRGGMAIVYEARQLRLNRVVALKMIRSGGNATPEEAIRFQAEAEVIASFQHPNIVRVHAIGDFEGQPYFEMEYVAGGSLATQLDGTPRQPRGAASLMEVIARAIHEAHRRGIVHRDLKPSNVLMMPDGTPKIADFGLAKLLNHDSGLTQTESVLGSPAYMAPELADGRARHAGPSADVYALGVIFYELLTGRPPFRAPSVLETLDLVRHSEPVPPSQLQPGLPRDAETIVLRSLAKEPERRYTSAEAMADDLGRFLRNEPILARPIGPIGRGVRWARRNQLVAGLMTAVLVVLLGGFTGMAVLWDKAIQERNRASDLKNRADRNAKEAVNQKNAAALLSASLAIDSGLALAKAGHSAQGLHQLAKAVRLGESDRKLVRVALANIAALSPEVPLLVGAAPRTTGPINCGAISPDGRLYAEGGFDGLVTIWNLDTMRMVGHPGLHDQDPKLIQNVAFSPDGRTVVSSADDGPLRIWSTTDGLPIGPPLRSPGLKSDATFMAYQPGGEIVASRSEKFVCFWQIATGKLIAKSGTCNDSAIDLVFSANGKTLVTVHYENIYRWDGATGRPIGSPIRLRNAVRTAGVSPDGQRLAVAYGNRELIGYLGDGRPVLLIYDVATGVATKPIPKINHDHVAAVHVLKYSPDGKRILVGDSEGTVQLFDAEGNPVGFAFKCEGIIRDSAFSPDSQTVLVTTSSGTAWLLDARDGRRLGSAIEARGKRLQAAFRPDGRTIVLAGDDSIRTFDIAEAVVPGLWFQKGAISVAAGPQGIWVAGFDQKGREGKPRKIGMGAIWTGDGKRTGHLLQHHDSITVIAFRDDGSLIATGSHDGTIRFFDREGHPVGKPIPQSHWPMCMAFDRAGDRLLVGCVDNTTCLFDVATHLQIGQIRHHPGNESQSGICLVAALDDVNIAVSVSRDGTVRRMRLDTGEPVGVPWQYPMRKPSEGLKPSKSQVIWSRAAISPDRRTLMVVAGGSVHLSDAETGQDGPAPFGREITSAAFLPDGKSIFTGGNDRIARIWDVSQVLPVGSALANPRVVEQVGLDMSHLQAVMEVVISPDGQTLLTIDLGGSVQLWDFATHKPIGPPRSHDMDATPPVFSADGRWLALIHESVELVPIPVPVDDDLDHLLASLKLRTGVKLNDQDGFNPIDVKVGQQVETPTSEADWHSRMARKCEIREEDDAVLWHLDRLARLRPESSDVQSWRSSVLKRLGLEAKATEAEAVARPPAMPE